MRIFVAGATGAVGRGLVPLLVSNGHEVVGLTRTPEKAEAIRALGAQAAVADGLDAELDKTRRGFGEAGHHRARNDRLARSV